MNSTWPVAFVEAMMGWELTNQRVPGHASVTRQTPIGQMTTIVAVEYSEPLRRSRNRGKLLEDSTTDIYILTTSIE
jgi:hypothetical protein